MSFITSSDRQIITDRQTVCAKCGKSMRVQSRQSYVYKAVNRNGLVRYFCSWHCMNEGCTEISKSKKQVKTG